MLEQVVTTLASVADTAEDKFIDYYDRLAKLLMVVPSTPSRLYKIECIRPAPLFFAQFCSLLIG